MLDLALLICETKIYFADMYRKKNEEYPDYPRIKRVPLQGGAMNVAMCTDNEHLEDDVKLFDQCLHEDDEIISERLHRLSALLKELGY